MAGRIIQLVALFLVGLLVAVMMLVFSVSCDNQPKEISAELGEDVELKIGQTVSVVDEPIKIKFVEVVGDSRCPTGATCVWQGEVTCILEITYLDESYTKTITQPGLTQQMSTDVFQEYEINFNILPYPELDKEIKADEYRLQLVIDKN
jgi:hypothetical protein